jgi:membrane protein
VGDGRKTVAKRSLVDRVEHRLPGPASAFVARVRGDDILLFSAGLAFYALVSIVPLALMVFWLTGLILGEQRLHAFAQDVERIAPKGLGLDQALTRVTDVGTSLGLAAILAGLWPSSAYGSGLVRAFDRLSPRQGRRLKGLLGRGLLLLALLPLFVLGTLIAAFLGTAFFPSGLAQLVGWAVALLLGFAMAWIAVALIYRTFPPERLPWSPLIKGATAAASGISLLSLAFAVYLGMGANFDEHYATSGLAGVVFLALWLFLANVLVLVGYKLALES